MKSKQLIAFLLMLIGTGVMYFMTILYLMSVGKSDIDALLWSSGFLICSLCGNAYLWSEL